MLNARVYDLAIESPLQYAFNLSQMVGNQVWLKREDLQPVFSFKVRGAYNKLIHLSREQMQTGVVACSAGNHAQGVALSASKLGIPATIVMPLATPEIKASSRRGRDEKGSRGSDPRPPLPRLLVLCRRQVQAVRRFGGPTVNVVLHGSSYDEAAAEAKRLVEQEGRMLIHPFDDDLVIAGQGTVALEMLKQTTSSELDAIFVCCGGGSLLAGVAAYVKQVRPSVKVIGVEAEDAAGMTASLNAGRVVTLEHVGLFADGAAVRTIGNETFRVCNALVDDMVTVSTDGICEAIKAAFNDTRSVLEPAGALGIAGMRKYLRENGVVGSNVIAITSGANMDFNRLRFVSERSDSREVLMAVRIPERPGAFREFYSHILPRNVTGFTYRFHTDAHADVIVSFQAHVDASRSEDVAAVSATLRARGYTVSSLSDNEMAKVHVRHLAGGRAPQVQNERLYRFEFPEAPGALSKFLGALNQGWNVSLFHYRNQGDDFGRVLVGVQVAPEQEGAFQRFLSELGYTYYRETDNPLFSQFLK